MSSTVIADGLYLMNLIPPLTPERQLLFCPSYSIYRDSVVARSKHVAWSHGQRPAVAKCRSNAAKRAGFNDHVAQLATPEERSQPLGIDPASWFHSKSRKISAA